MIDNLNALPSVLENPDNCRTSEWTKAKIRRPIEQMVMATYRGLKSHAEEAISGVPVRLAHLYAVINSPVSQAGVNNSPRIGRDFQEMALAELSAYGANFNLDPNKQNCAEGYESLTYVSSTVDWLSFTRKISFYQTPRSAFHAAWTAQLSFTDAPPDSKRGEIADLLLRQVATIVPQGLITMATENDLALPDGTPRFLFGPHLTQTERIQLSKYLYNQIAIIGGDRFSIFVENLAIPIAITGELPEGDQAKKLINAFGGIYGVANQFQQYCGPFFLHFISS